MASTTCSCSLVTGALCIYVLRLEQGRWYVGSTTSIRNRVRVHQEGTGSAWTAQFRFVALEAIYPNADLLDEDKRVKEYMMRYGIENVSGGSYCKMILPAEEMSSLQRELLSAKDACLRCGEKGHYADSCTARLKMNTNKPNAAKWTLNKQQETESVGFVNVPQRASFNSSKRKKSAPDSTRPSAALPRKN